jgi:hypothetical protein
MTDANTGMKVYPTWELLEKTDPAEWGSLSAANKAKFQLIISAGTLYFTDGGIMRGILLDLFPEGTTTGDAFRLL